MLLYSVVLYVFLGAPAEENAPIMIYNGTAMYSESACKQAAAATLHAAKIAVRKTKLPLTVDTYCDRTGVEV